MKVLLQRVKKARVLVDEKVINNIANGLLLFVGFTQNDGVDEIDYMVDKIINMRIFDDENGIMNKSIIDMEGSILSISQFTLYADYKKGRRPSYVNALNNAEASSLYDLFNQKLNSKITTKTGVFGANMQVELINDGPVTIMLERSESHD